MGHADYLIKTPPRLRAPQRLTHQSLMTSDGYPAVVDPFQSEEVTISVHESVIHFAPVVYGTGVVIGPFVVLGSAAPAYPLTPSSVSSGERHTQTISIGDNSYVGPHSVVDSGTSIGNGTWIGAGVRIGAATTIGSDTEIYYHAQVYDRVTIGDRCTIGGFVGNDSIVENGSVVMGSLIHSFDITRPSTPESAPLVMTDSFVGFNATVIGNVTVHSRAFVAAGAVVTHDVPPGRMFAGAPAKDIGPSPQVLRKGID